MNTQQVSSLVRQIGSSAISAGYAALVAAGHTHGIPAAVDAIIIGFGPAVVTLEHYLSDPSTGTPPAPSSPETNEASTPLPTSAPIVPPTPPVS